jgi:peptidoglycan-associated lipoprotein
MRSPAISRSVWFALAVAVGVTLAGCASKKPPVARPISPPSSVAIPDQVPVTPAAPPPQAATPAQPVADTPAVRSDLSVKEDPLATRAIDDVNRESPLQPAFFDYDSAELTAEARTALDANAAVLKKYPTWVVTIEGHCDERGTAEYNLALGERRAVAAQAYLVSLAIAPARLRTVSYGKEFPFDPGSNEAAWAKNRRAHFVLTAK